MDVLSNAMQIRFIPYDMVVIPGLPGKVGIVIRANAACACSLELTDYCAEGRWFGDDRVQDAPPGRLYDGLEGKNAMQVIGHDDICIQHNGRTQSGSLVPFLVHDLSHGR